MFAIFTTKGILCVVYILYVHVHVCNYILYVHVCIICNYILYVHVHVCNYILYVHVHV